MKTGTVRPGTEQVCQSIDVAKNLYRNAAPPAKGVQDTDGTGKPLEPGAAMHLNGIESFTSFCNSCPFYREGLNFDYKVHIGVDKDTGLVHTMKVAAANVHLF